MATCKKICMEWHEVQGKFKVSNNCKCLTIKKGRAQCKKYPENKLLKVVAGEVFYLGGKK